MCKFTKLDSSTQPTHWGYMFTFDGVPRQTQRARKLRQQVLHGTMPEKTAKKRLETLEPDKPYLDGDEYIADMAALPALHWDEVDSKTLSLIHI